MTKTFRDNFDINIVQQTSCEPLFPDVQIQLKMYFFVPFVLPSVAYAENFPGGLHSLAYGGHLYLVCAVCDVTI